MVGGHRLIAFDLDGTVIRPSGRLSKPDLHALERANRAGCTLAVVTGRPFAVVPSALKNNPAIRWIAAASGGELWDRDTGAVTLRTIPIETAARLVALAEDSGAGLLVSRHGVQMRNARLLPESRRLLRRRERLSERVSLLALILYQAIKIRRVNDVGAQLQSSSEPIIKVELFTANSDAFRSLLRAAGGLPGLTVVEVDDFGVEITADGADKGAAIAELCRRGGYSKNQVLAIGDGTNDLTMRAAAGTLVAMGDACSELKAVADLIAPTVGEAGVAHVLNQLSGEADAP